MPAEVPVACGIAGGNHCKIARKGGQIELTLSVHQAFLFQTGYCRALAQFRLPERQFRLYVTDYQTQSIELAIIDLTEGKYAYSGFQIASGSLPERSCYLWINAAPDYRPRLGNDTSRVALG